MASGSWAIFATVIHLLLFPTYAITGHLPHGRARTSHPPLALPDAWKPWRHPDRVRALSRVSNSLRKEKTHWQTPRSIRTESGNGDVSLCIRCRCNANTSPSCIHK